MKTLVINAAAIMFAAIMLTSCDKESLVPISDISESSSFLSESSADARQSDDVQSMYNMEDGQTAEDEKTPADTKYSEAESSVNALQSDDVQTTYGEESKSHDVRSDYAKERQTHADPKYGQASFDENTREGDVERSGWENSDGPETVEKSYPNSLSENTASRNWKQGEGSEKTDATETDPAKDESDQTRATVNAIKVNARKK